MRLQLLLIATVLLISTSLSSGAFVALSKRYTTSNHILLTMSLRIPDRSLFPMNHMIHTRRRTGEMKGRLGHLRPRLWSSHAYCVEEASTTTLPAKAHKFKNFDDMLRTYSNVPVLVAFEANWCGPCRLMKKELSEVSDRCSGEGVSVKLFNINSEKFPKLAQRYDIEGLPTLILFKGGKIVEKIEGVSKADEIVRLIKSNS
jgi:thiol-disulfide isomerase/thioredoxin